MPYKPMERTVEGVTDIR